MEPLQIIISAIDEASEQIQNIATSLSEISDAAEAAVSAVMYSFLPHCAKHNSDQSKANSWR